MTTLKSLTITALLGGAMMLSSPSAVPAQESMTREQLVGTWHLVSFKSTSGNQVSYPLGERPGGYVGFTATRFWVMLVDEGRKTPAAVLPSDAEAISLMRTHAAYTGRYDTDPTQTPTGIKVTIHVDAASNQAITGTHRSFFMRVDGNKLTIETSTAINAITGVTAFAQLEFVKAN
jgi:hypothetical protein